MYILGLFLLCAGILFGIGGILMAYIRFLYTLLQEGELVTFVILLGLILLIIGALILTINHYSIVNSLAR